MKAILLLAGLGSVVGAAGGGHLYLQRLEDEMSGGAKVPVLVVAKDAAVGTILTQQQLAIRDIPEAFLDSRVVRASDTKRVVGSRLSVGLKAQQSLLWSDLAAFTDQTKMLSTVISQGMRAVELDGKVSNFDGLLRPGDRVDLLFTATEGSTAGKSTVTLLQNLLVLSVGGSMERGEEGDGDKRRVMGRGVTVSASLAQAQVITQARTRGTLTLTLRNPDDVKVVDGLPETTDKEINEARASGTASVAAQGKN